MDFGDEIKKERTEREMSQRALAKKIGVSQFQIFSLENWGQKAAEGMSVVVFAKLCFLFGFDKNKIHAFLKKMVKK